MTDNKTKPFWESKTYLSLVPLVAVLLYKSFGVEVSEIEITQILESLGVATSMIMIIYGRYKADSKLTLLPKKK